MFSLLRHTPLSVFLDSTVLLAACLVLTVQQVWSVLQPHKNQQDNASQVCSLIFFPRNYCALNSTPRDSCMISKYYIDKMAELFLNIAVYV